MEKRLNLSIKNQPSYTSCGPTSLHSVYSFYNDDISLEQLVEDIDQFAEGGGTLGVVLGIHALARSYDVSIISYNMNIFDPSWFGETESNIKEKLQESFSKNSQGPKRAYAIDQYIRFLEAGGKLHFADLTTDLLQEILDKDVPILTGLSSTWLYRDQRENPKTNQYDPIDGEPAGHFVVIDGYDLGGEFSICDPYQQNPINNKNHYLIDGSRLINAILLGVHTYDGNLLLIEKKEK